MKRLLIILLAALLFLSGCAVKKQAAPEFNIAVASDIHYMLINVNRMFFSGNLENAAMLDPDGHLTELWTEQQPLTGSYLDSLRSEYGNNYNFFTIP